MCDMDMGFDGGDAGEGFSDDCALDDTGGGESFEGLDDFDDVGEIDSGDYELDEAFEIDDFPDGVDMEMNTDVDMDFVPDIDFEADIMDESSFVEFPEEIYEDEMFATEISEEEMFEDSPKVLTREPMELLETGSKNIDDILDVKADDYRDKGFEETEIAEMLEQDRHELQEEFLQDAFSEQNITTDVFDTINTEGTQDGSENEDTIFDEALTDNIQENLNEDLEENQENNFESDFLEESEENDFEDNLETFPDEDMQIDLSEDEGISLEEDITEDEEMTEKEDIAEEKELIEEETKNLDFLLETQEKEDDEQSSGRFITYYPEETEVDEWSGEYAIEMPDLIVEENDIEQNNMGDSLIETVETTEIGDLEENYLDAAENITETNSEISEINIDYDSIYEEIEQAALEQGYEHINIDADTNRLEYSLEQFDENAWENLSIDEKRTSINVLGDYIKDIIDFEKPPVIEYYNNEREGEFGGYDPTRNTLLINEYMLDNSEEAVDTIAHELWHAYQQECALNPKSARDYQYQYNFDNYISPECGFEEYQNQLVEAEARSFASQFRERIRTH